MYEQAIKATSARLDAIRNKLKTMLENSVERTTLLRQRNELAMNLQVLFVAQREFSNYNVDLNKKHKPPKKIL